MQARSSAITMDSQMPSSCNNNGNINTAPTWYNAVRENDMMADTKPLLRAVKKADENIDTPANTNEKEKITKACNVISSKPWS